MDLLDEPGSAGDFLPEGISAEDRQAFLAYNQPWFRAHIPDPLPHFPLDPEPSLAVWEDYASEAARRDWPAVLAERLPAFRFPVAEGMSRDSAYRQAVTKGEGSAEKGLHWERADQLNMEVVYPPSGPIPVLSTPIRADFETLLRVFLYRNEPQPIPPTMGAVMISGFVNRDRINRLREDFFTAHPEVRRSAWRKEWEMIQENRKALYQDRLILIGPGPYSGVPAAEIGLTEADWQVRSRTIRIHHECTHLFCKRVFGSMQNNLFDELLADFMGFRESFGSFSANLFLRCMGISPEGELGETGRFFNYLKEPVLPYTVWKCQARLLAMAARRLEEWSWAKKPEGHDPVGPLLLALARLSLPEIADAALPDSLT